MHILHLSPASGENASRIYRFTAAVRNIQPVKTTLLCIGKTFQKSTQDHIHYIRYTNKFFGNISGLSLLNRLVLYVSLSFGVFFLRADVLVVHNYKFLPLALIAKLFHKAKVVYEPHELQIGISQSSASMLVLFLLEFIHIRICVDAILVVNRASFLYYTHLSDSTRIYVAHNSPSADYLPTELRLKSSLNLTANDFVFVYIGAFQEGRYLKEAIDTFQRLSLGDPSIHLCLLGYGPLLPELEARIQSENIHIVPAVSEKILVPFISDCDAGIVLAEPSCLNDYLCLPNKLFQTAYAGIPILSCAGLEVSNLVSRLHIGKSILNIEDTRPIKEFIEEVRNANYKPCDRSVIDNNYNPQHAYQELFRFLIK